MAAGTDAPNNAMGDVKVVNNEQFKDQYNSLVSWFHKYPGLTPRRRRAGPTCHFPPQAHFWVLLQKGKKGCRRPPTARQLRKILR